MEIKASLNYLRMAPRKVRLVANLISGLEVQDAENELKFLNKRAVKPVVKLLNSAIANAKKKFNFDEKRLSSLYIKKIIVDEGPKLKRLMPVSRGMAHQIQKKTSHITMILDEKISREGGPKKRQKS